MGLLIRSELMNAKTFLTCSRHWVYTSSCFDYYSFLYKDRHFKKFKQWSEDINNLKEFPGYIWGNSDVLSTSSWKERVVVMYDFCWPEFISSNTQWSQQSIQIWLCIFQMSWEKLELHRRKSLPDVLVLFSYLKMAN